MPSFPTPDPIDVAIDLPVGRIDVTASDRVESVIDVAPSNPARASDVRDAEETRVEFDGRRLTIASPRRFSLIGPTGSVDITIEVPTGSRLTAEISVGPIRTTGRLGATRIKSSTGLADLGAVGDLQLDVAHGGATVAAIDGSADIKSGHGGIEIGAVTGAAVVKSSHGSVRVERSGTAFEANLAYGNLDILHASGTVVAKTSYGNVRLADVSGASVRLETSYGQLSVGVREGIAVRLDAASKIGRVRNELGIDRAPEAGEPTLEIRARTQGGDVVVHRAR